MYFFVFLYDAWQIALESVCVIDNGETMLVEGLRVAPQERGKGVAGVLLRFCCELVKSKYPEVKVSRLTRDDQLGPKDFQKYRIITKQVPATKAGKIPFLFWLVFVVHSCCYWLTCFMHIAISLCFKSMCLLL